MAFIQEEDYLAFESSEDLWKIPDNLLSVETSTPVTGKASFPLDLPIMDNIQGSWWPHPSSEPQRTHDVTFHNFEQDQYASAGNRQNAGPMLHFQGSMMSGIYEAPGFASTPSAGFDIPQKRRSVNPRNRNDLGGRVPKRKKMDSATSAYGPKARLTPNTRASQKQDGYISDEECNSGAESTATCCSSCDDGPPCEDPHCAIPCAESACEMPICPSSDCPEVCPQVPVIQAPQMQYQPGSMSFERVSLLHQSDAETWNLAGSPRSTSGRQVHLDSLLDHTLRESHSDSRRREDPESSIPPTPSMLQNAVSPYSPEAALQTPQFMGLPQAHFSNETNATTGEGEMFPASMDDWNTESFAESGNTSLMFNCPWDSCTTAISDEQFFFQHLHQAHLDPQYTYGCPIQSSDCPTTLESNPLSHLQTQHGFDMNENFSCPAPTCSPAETYNDPAMFHNHFDQAHATPAQGLLFCRLASCNGSFLDQSQLLSHIHETHQLPITAPKMMVGVKSSTSSSILSDPGEEEIVAHTCKWQHQGGGVCGANCENEKELQEHVKHDHLASLSKSTGYICKWEGCNRPAKMGDKQGFSQRGKLERHMASHTNFKCSECDICHQMFSAEQAMKQHRLLHTGEKPWKCKFCDKRFPQQSACTIHERTHTKDKPLICEICGKKFSESSNFAKHRRIHGELGKHKCPDPTCGKTFHRTDQLKKHMKKHESMASQDGSDDEGSDDGTPDRSS